MQDEDGARSGMLLPDVMLPGKAGLALAKELRKRDDRVSIISAASMEEYLWEGYFVRPHSFYRSPCKAPRWRTRYAPI